MTDEEAHAVRASLSQFSLRDQVALASTARDAKPLLLWERHREVYEVHPAMTRALIRMKSDIKVPASVLRRLRHPNPMFTLPAAPPVTLLDGQPGRVFAVVVNGALSGSYEQGSATADLQANQSMLLDSHSPHANGYSVTVFSEVLSPDGSQVIDNDMCHITIPIVEDFTIDGLIEKTVADGFDIAAEDAEASSSEQSRLVYLRAVTRIVVAHLLYACSRTFEVTDARNGKPPAKRKAGKPRPPKPARMRRVGYRMGTAIADSLRRHQEAPMDSVATGRKLVPHTRAPHLHMYRVGPGRREIEMKLLDLMFINTSADDGTTVTVHPVR
ncbi:hypothetical protein ACFZAM_31705 [Streptomyces sp. NPDC008079]|uniref:hypothetical protein n=1 Tax=Streptomyces sp. NPDC008079 TaxID=3364806 RepID=UPI0036E2D6E1